MLARSLRCGESAGDSLWVNILQIRGLVRASSAAFLASSLTDSLPDVSVVCMVSPIDFLHNLQSKSIGVHRVSIGSLIGLHR